MAGIVESPKPKQPTTITISGQIIYSPPNSTTIPTPKANPTISPPPRYSYHLYFISILSLLYTVTRPVKIKYAGIEVAIANIKVKKG